MLPGISATTRLPVDHFIFLSPFYGSEVIRDRCIKVVCFFPMRRDATVVKYKCINDPIQQLLVFLHIHHRTASPHPFLNGLYPCSAPHFEQSLNARRNAKGIGKAKPSPTPDFHFDNT